MNFPLSLSSLLALYLLTLTSPGWSALPFSSKQKADIIERINICQQPIFEDGYETGDFKISIFKEQNGSFIYCGYSKKTQAKIILTAIRGNKVNPEVIWQARNGTVLYTIKVSGESSYIFSITERGSRIYQAEAWSVYPP
jgi:hypothetical protein